MHFYAKVINNGYGRTCATWGRNVLERVFYIVLGVELRTIVLQTIVLQTIVLRTIVLRTIVLRTFVLQTIVLQTIVLCCRNCATKIAEKSSCIVALDAYTSK